MSLRWISRFHLTPPGRRLALVLGMLIVALLLAGCGGGLRHESWPGMILADGTIYAANLETIQALNADTGKVYWSYPAEEGRNAGVFYSTPVLAADQGPNGLLLVAGFRDRSVHALALGETPAERPDLFWSFNGAGGQYVGSGTVANGLFLIGNGDGKVYALRLSDGSLAWSFATRDRVWATPVVVGDVVYVASLDHTLYVVDWQSGDEVSRIPLGGAIASTPVLVGDSLWVGDFSGRLSQIDLATRTVVWSFKVDDWIWTTPLVDGTILYFADVGGQVYALDTVSRELLWDPARIDDVLRARPALSPDRGLLYVAGYEKGRVHAIDTATGRVRQAWGAELPNPGRLPGDLVSDARRVYTMPILVDERIQAFDVLTGELLWSQGVSR